MCIRDSIYRDKEALKAGSNQLKILKEVGQDLRIVDKKSLLDLVPELSDSRDVIAGGIFSPNDESGDSRLFTENLMKVCRSMISN